MKQTAYQQGITAFQMSGRYSSRSSRNPYRGSDCDFLLAEEWDAGFRAGFEIDSAARERTQLGNRQRRLVRAGLSNHPEADDPSDMALSQRDREAFAAALLNPPAPSESLKRAVQRHRNNLPDDPIDWSDYNEEP